MSLTVNAVIQNGQIKLEKPVSVPDGTKALVTFYPNKIKESRREWLEKYYRRTKNVYLGKDLENAVNVAKVKLL